jgi:hypothetical protein
MPFRRFVRGPVASVSRSRPDDQRQQGPTVSTYAFNRRHHGSLHTSTSVALSIIFTYQDLDRAKHAQHDSCLIHVVYVLWHDARVLQDRSDDVEPLHDLFVYVIGVALPVDRSDSLSLELRVPFLEGLRPVLARGLRRSIPRCSLTGYTEGQRAYELDAYRLPEVRLEQQEPHEGNLLLPTQVLLALGLLLARASSTITMNDSGEGSVAIF